MVTSAKAKPKWYSFQPSEGIGINTETQKRTDYILLHVYLSVYEVLSVAQNSGYIPIIFIHYPDFKLHPALEHALAL